MLDDTVSGSYPQISVVIIINHQEPSFPAVSLGSWRGKTSSTSCRVVLEVALLAVLWNMMIGQPRWMGRHAMWVMLCYQASGLGVLDSSTQLNGTSHCWLKPLTTDWLVVSLMYKCFWGWLIKSFVYHQPADVYQNLKMHLSILVTLFIL